MAEGVQWELPEYTVAPPASTHSTPDLPPSFVLMNEDGEIILTRGGTVLQMEDILEKHSNSWGGEYAVTEPGDAESLEELAVVERNLHTLIALYEMDDVELHDNGYYGAWDVASLKDLLGEVPEVRTELRQQAQEEADEAASEAASCNGALNRATGTIGHVIRCPIHGR